MRLSVTVATASRNRAWALRAAPLLGQAATGKLTLGQRTQVMQLYRMDFANFRFNSVTEDAAALAM